MQKLDWPSWLKRNLFVSTPTDVINSNRSARAPCGSIFIFSAIGLCLFLALFALSWWVISSCGSNQPALAIFKGAWPWKDWGMDGELLAFAALHPIWSTATIRRQEQVFSSKGGLWFLLDSDLRLLDASPAAAQLMDEPVSQLEGKNLLDLGIPTEGSLLLKEHFASTLARKQPSEIRIKLGLGASTHKIELSLNPILQRSSAPAILVIGRNVRERQTAKQSRANLLQEVSTTLISHLTEQEIAKCVTQMPLAKLGATGGILFLLNDDADELELIGSAGFDSLQGEILQRFTVDSQTPYAQVIRSGQPVVVDATKSTDQTNEANTNPYHSPPYHSPPYHSPPYHSPPYYLPIDTQLLGLMVCSPLIASGKAIGVLSLIFPREHRINDDEIALLNAIAKQTGIALERARRYEAQKIARAEAQFANTAKDHFLAMISHELRNPLTAIKTGLHLLKKTCPKDTQTQRALDIVDRNTDLQARLVNDMLNLSRLQQGKLQLDQRPVELSSVVRAATALYWCEANESGNTIRVDRKGEGDLWVQGDMDRLQQVVTNLLSNAIKFTPPPGEITISYSREQDPSSPTHDQKINLMVEDTGIGIDPYFMSRLFDMFSQDKTTVNGKSGLGIGLALVKEIVDQHGGKVWAENKPCRKGCRFTVQLPSIQPPTPSDGIA